MHDTSLPTPVWDHYAVAAVNQPVDWLWGNYLARGNLTLLTSQWKAGKTTLLSLLLARRKAGGTLAGMPVKPGNSLIVSEEPLSLWADRGRRYDFGGRVCFLIRPFRSLPSPKDWQRLLDSVRRIAHEHTIDLVVIDPLAPFLRDENRAHDVLEALLPLTALANLGLAALILHHPGKGRRRPGQSARGSGALLGHVDISIEMRHCGGHPQSRRRRFVTQSRHPQVPPPAVFELDAAATDYLPVPSRADEHFHRVFDPLLTVLGDAPQKLTRADILAEWPADFQKPGPLRLWRCLDTAVANNLIQVEGTGRKRDPFRYWLPASEAVWKENLLYDHFEKQRRDLGLPFQSLQERKAKLGDDDFGPPDLGAPLQPLHERDAHDPDDFTPADPPP